MTLDIKQVCIKSNNNEGNANSYLGKKLSSGHSLLGASCFARYGKNGTLTQSEQYKYSNPNFTKKKIEVGENRAAQIRAGVSNALSQLSKNDDVLYDTKAKFTSRGSHEADQIATDIKKVQEAKTEVLDIFTKNTQAEKDRIIALNKITQPDHIEQSINQAIPSNQESEANARAELEAKIRAEVEASVRAELEAKAKEVIEAPKEVAEEPAMVSEAPKEVAEEPKAKTSKANK